MQGLVSPLPDSKRSDFCNTTCWPPPPRQPAVRLNEPPGQSSPSITLERAMPTRLPRSVQPPRPPSARAPAQLELLQHFLGGADSDSLRETARRVLRDGISWEAAKPTHSEQVQPLSVPTPASPLPALAIVDKENSHEQQLPASPAPKRIIVVEVDAPASATPPRAAAAPSSSSPIGLGGPPSGPSLREMVLEEELRTARLHLEDVRLAHRRSEQALEHKLRAATSRLVDLEQRATQAESAASAAVAAAAAAAAHMSDPTPLALPWEMSMETLADVTEQGARELALMIELHASCEAAKMAGVKEAHALALAAMRADVDAAEGAKRAADDALESEVARRVAAEAAVEVEKSARAELELSVASEQLMRRAQEATLAEERRGRVAAEEALEHASAAAEAAADEAQAWEAKALEAVEAASEVATRATQMTLAQEMATTGSLTGDSAWEAARQLESHAASREMERLHAEAERATAAASAASADLLAKGAPREVALSTSPVRDTVAAFEARADAESPHSGLATAARAAARDWLIANEEKVVDSPAGHMVSTGTSPQRGGVAPSPSSTPSRAAAATTCDAVMATDASTQAAGGGMARVRDRASSCSEYAPFLPSCHSLTVPSCTPPRGSPHTLALFGRYLTWRRQVNGLLHLPAPVRGIASSGGWGITEGERAAAPPPRVAIDERKTIYTYACSDASVDENAFDQGAAQLQSEFDDLIGGVLATSAATAHRR